MKIQSLADFLGTAPTPEGEPESRLEDITNAKQFAEAVLTSREFRQYIVSSLSLGSLPSAVICRLMDYAWGKPPDRVEHTGKDGNPIEAITEVRRVVVHVNGNANGEQTDASTQEHYTTH